MRSKEKQKIIENLKSNGLLSKEAEDTVYNKLLEIETEEKDNYIKEINLIQKMRLI